MIHPDFTLIERELRPRQTGPVLFRPSVDDMVDALAGVKLHSAPAIAFLREPMDMPDKLDNDVYLQTSGTTGKPKLIGHRMSHLTSRIRPVDPMLPGAQEIWLLTYNPASFAGLQVILTAAMRGATLVVGGVEDALTHQVTHVSGTPTFWRLFLSELGGRELPLQAVTLGGERADQVILNALSNKFPDAHLAHIYASTEAGSVFSVQDGQEGFPISWLEQAPEGLSLRINEGNILEVRSSHAAQDDWIVTGDLVERAGDRILFAGRIDDMINVGGVKIRPATVEDIALSVDGVADTLCYGKANPVTGQIVALEVVLVPGQDEAEIKARLKQAFQTLDRAAQPRLIRIVEHFNLGTGNKKIRTR